MFGFRPTPGDPDGATFDEADSFVPANLPEPGPFLADHRVLTGEEHVAFHRVTREVFEERRVYDATFGYNLARLNRDTRHPDAGYRYAAESTDSAVLRAEFTPTTPFCPQSEALTVGSFRAWNGLSERHEFDLVRVRVAPMHHRSESINEELADLEAAFLETGEVPDPATGAGDEPGGGALGGPGDGSGGGSATGGASAPF